MTWGLIIFAFVLLIMLLFIFVGIQAFALGGAMGAIINSLIPMGIGAGASGDQKTKGEVVEAANVEMSV